MKHFKLYLLLLFPLIIFSGCIKVNTTIKVNKDGSGIIEQLVLMSPQAIEMMTQFMSSFQDSTGQAEKFSIYNEEDVKNDAKDFGDNVKFVSAEEVVVDGWEGYNAVYAFDNLNELQMNADLNDKIPSDFEEEEEQNNDEYIFKFIPGDVAQIIIDRPEELDTPAEEETGDEYDESQEENGEMNEQMLQMMKGMAMDISLELNGEIVETNASHVDGSRVTLLSIDFDELFKNKESLEMFKKNPPDDIEELSKMVKDVPGIKLELQKPVIIKFK